METVTIAEAWPQYGQEFTIDDLDRNYATACDPRLNYRQALEMGFRIAKRLGSHPRAPSR